jgi:uncharacterized RmlC-like cupin family protein
MVVMSGISTIPVVRPDQFDAGTAQPPGSERRAAIAPELGVESALWGGTFEVEPSARTGVHHHECQQTIAYVLSGTCEIRCGEKGKFAAHARPGDFIPVSAYLPHMEINPSKLRTFRWIVVRSTPAPIVVNLPNIHWR